MIEEDQYMPVVEADTVHMNDFMSLAALEQQLNLCPGEIEQLNPELARKAVPEDAGSYALRVPAQVSDLLREQKLALYDSTAKQNKEMLAYFKRNETGSTYGRERITYRVRSGDFLGRIARNHGVGVSDIRHWNRLRGNNIYAGQRLTLYVKSGVKGVPGSNPIVRSGSKYYTVQAGDTLWEISKKRGVSVAQLKQLNGLSTSNIKVGQKLILSK
jgi:membrane-bound lytic murein transglycosylase D